MPEHKYLFSVKKMMVMEVKIKRLYEHVDIPEKATKGAAGFDLVAIDYRYDHNNHYHEYGTGLSIELPQNYEAQIRPRSSISKNSLVLVNSPGTIDSDYRGEIIVRFKEIDDRGVLYNVGDRIAQLVIQEIPEVNFVEVTELASTDRGSGGFGSTGK